MANQPQQIPVTDPENVPEVLCDGQLNVSVMGNFATLTFTHVRPVPSQIVLEMGDAISGISRVASQAARSIG
jgi:hypothetical protein